MKWFLQLSLAKKLLTTFVTLAAITAGVGLYGLHNILRVGGLMNAMYENNLVAVDHLSEAYSRYLVYTRAVTRAPTQNAKDLAATEERMKGHWEKSTAALNSYRTLLLSETEKQLLQKLASQLNPAAPPKLQWIQASVGQSIQMIPVEEVLFFISDEKYTRVQTATTEALIRKPIKELLEELDMALFWQIHRSTLVNTRAIAGVTRDLRGRQLVSVKGHPEKLEVSRSFTGLFKGM